MAGKRTHRGTTGQCYSIDIRWLKRKGFLDQRPRRKLIITGYDYLEWINDDWLYIYHPLSNKDGKLRTIANLVYTDCNYGGKRPWFSCPSCSERVAILYNKGCSFYACRKCHDLSYQCQRETLYDRQHRKANKIRLRLDSSWGIANGMVQKPKRMKLKTYWLAFLKYEKLIDAICAVDIARFNNEEEGLKLDHSGNLY